MSEPGQEEMAPYVIEGARSSRSRCKTCRRTIDKGALRIGMLIEGPYGTGYLWHHLRCAARRQFDRVAEAYEAEAWKEAKEAPSKVPELEEPQGCIDILSPLEQQEMTFIKGYSKSHCRVCPKPGDLLIFPAYCKHFVHPFQGEGERLCVVFNAVVHQQRLGKRRA